MEFEDYGHIDLCIHNGAVEQLSYFKVVFKVLELLDPEKYKGKNYHTAYEFVGLKTGKMSSRKGIVVLANDVIDEAHKRIAGVIADRDLADKEEVAETIGVGAVKYSFLSVNPNTYFSFDLETSLSFEGNSGPYLQYTYARANKILLDYAEIDFQLDVNEYVFAEKEEIELLEKLVLYPEVVIEAGKGLNTNEIATYIFDLAQLFNSFYKQHQILNMTDEQVKKSRIALTAATAQVIKNGLNLLGIKTVERM
jgi:arginyl-tRNA synthetase